jgi:uncharacterized protein (TIGR00297 family)
MCLIVIILDRVAWVWKGSGENRLWLVLGATVVFAVLAYLVHGVTRSGAIAGAVVCFVLFATAGPGAFLVLLVLFALTWAATRMGQARKERFGTAERGAGRSGSQVLANLGTAAACALLYGLQGTAGWLLVMSSALSEVAADTVSSEYGQAFRNSAVLITTLETVPAGTDGGITLAGTLAGTLAATLVAGSALLCGLISARGLGISIAAAVVGMLADSYLGAGLERRGALNNDGVNFLGTVAAASFSIVFLRFYP